MPESRAEGTRSTASAERSGLPFARDALPDEITPLSRGCTAKAEREVNHALFKEYTTPTIDIALEGAQDAIADAQAIIVTLKGRQTIEKTPTVDRSILSITLTQEETAILGVGTILIEVTLLTVGGAVLKSSTIKTTIDAAVRREVL